MEGSPAGGEPDRGAAKGESRVMEDWLGSSTVPRREDGYAMVAATGFRDTTKGDVGSYEGMVIGLDGLEMRLLFLGAGLQAAMLSCWEDGRHSQRCGHGYGMADLMGKEVGVSLVCK